MARHDSRPGPAMSRRGVLVGAGVAVGSATLGAFAGNARGKSEGIEACATTVGSANEPFYGPHQAGVRTSMQAHGVFAAFRLASTATARALAGVMRVATVEAARLTEGRPGISDSDPTLAVHPARLTITFGFGPRVFELPGLAALRPVGFVDMPSFAIDQLHTEHSGGDLLVHVGGDDPLTVSHAVRHMTRVVSSLASPHFAQRGFVRAAGVGEGETPRNLFGQKDGTANPRTDAEFDRHVWAGDDAGWFAGGTQLVLRRIAMMLPTWDRLGTHDKEQAMGRRLDTGAPLTGADEFDTPDFDAVGANGLAVIPDFAHIRNAHSVDGSDMFLRRPLSYDDGLNLDGSPDAGLLFTAYAANIEKQFLPVQQRLADFDLLNLWTTPIGSSTFVLPPGCREGGYIGEGLLG